MPTDDVGFEGFNISQITEAVIDSSFFAGEAEFARRLGRERDAWVFGGPYFLANDSEDTAGYRVGMRGYAFPDLLLQFAVSDDDIFNTNATFSMVWFVGRTRTNFQPACGVPDRFREPVMRNDYVVLAQSRTTDGVPLTQPNGDPLRVVHVDSSAPAGGDGSFENPLNNLEDILTSSQNGDIVLAHAESVFTGQEASLRNNQRFLGEGDGFTPTVATSEGTIDIPETAPGARNLDRPMILAAMGDAITLRDANEVANFDIDGQGVTTRAIAAPMNGAGNPNLHDLAISNTTGDGIATTPLTITDTNDVDNDNNTSEQIVRGNVTISDVTFDNIGGDDIDINAFTATDTTDPNVTLQETITITDVTSTNGNGAGVRLANTHDNRTATISNYTNGLAGTPGSGGGLAGQGVLRFEGTMPDDFDGDVVINNADIRNSTGFAFDFLNVSAMSTVTLGSGTTYDGGAGAAGGIRMDNFNGTFTGSNTMFTGGTLAGVQILNDSDGTFNFQNTFTLATIGGTDIEIDGGASDLFTGVFTFASNFTNSAGRSVVIRGISGAGTTVTINSAITDTGQGILVDSNSGGLILFTGNLDLDTTSNDAITLTNNAGTDVDFTGMVDINTLALGDAFVATGGGNLTVSGNNNRIATEAGQIALINGMTIDAMNGVNFIAVRRTTAGALTSAIQLENNTGGPITFGNPAEDMAGDSGTIAGGVVDAIVINNSANVTISALEINQTAGVSGVRVNKTTAGTQTVNLNDLAINAGDIGIELTGAAGAGNLNMTINDTMINDSTDVGLSITNVDAGTINVNATTIDGNPATAGAQGVLITDSDATITFDAQTLIQNWAAADFEATGDLGTINFNGEVVNTDATGNSVHIHNVSGGSLTFTANSSIDDENAGMLVEMNTGGTFSFLGTNTFDTAAADAVTVRNNTGNTDVLLEDLAITTTAGRGVAITGNASTTSVNVTGVDVTSTTGNAFVATGAGDLTVSGNNNVLQTTSGTGLTIDGQNIVAGATFEEVSVSAGTANGIVLRNVTGAQVTIGEAGGADGDGGILDTDGDAIVLENVANVDLLNVQVANASNAGAQGVNVDHTSATNMDVTFTNLDLLASNDVGVKVDHTSGNLFNLRVNSSAILERVDMDLTGTGQFALLVDATSVTTSGTDIAFDLNFSGSAADGDVTIRNTSTFDADDAEAFLLTASGAGKSVELNIDNNMFVNSSGTDVIAHLHATGGATLNANVVNNSFVNSLAAEELLIESDDPATVINLNIVNNGPVGAALRLREDGGTFNVVDLTNADANNPGSIIFDPNMAAFNDIMGPVEPPIVP
jgi:hypothetical protein